MNTITDFTHLREKLMKTEVFSYITILVSHSGGINAPSHNKHHISKSPQVNLCWKYIYNMFSSRQHISGV